MTRRQAVTGAFGYSGAAISEELLERDIEVVTLTNSSCPRSPLNGRVAVRPLRFDDPAALAGALEGAEVLYNTYWVRFNHRSFNHDEAVENSRVLFEAAKRAGVERVVHVSITNPSLESPLSYFRGKAEVEGALRESGLSHAILRPAVLFGGKDILINNMAWALRRFPVFGLFGDGSYRLRPIHVEDFAQGAVRLGQEREDVTLDAVGSESFSYRELIEMLARAIGVRRGLVALPHRLAWLAGSLLGKIQGDVMITWDEVRGLTDGLLDVEGPAFGETRLTDWAQENREALGRGYANELARRR